MLRYASALTLPIAALLAGCGGEPTVEASNASAADVAKQVQEATGGKALIEPGRWESQLKIEQVSMPGLPPEVAKQMQQGHMLPTKAVSCITPEQASKPTGEMLNSGGAAGCRYENFRMAGGTIEARAKCTQQGLEQTLEMAGTYAAETYEMRMKTAMTGEGPMNGMTSTMVVSGKRLGACDGSEAGAAKPGT